MNEINNFKQNISFILLCTLALSVNLGNVVDVFNIKLSWLIMLLFSISLVRDLYLRKYNLNEISKNRKTIILIFIFWLVVSTIQYFYINNMPYATDNFMILIINAFLFISLIFFIRIKEELYFLLFFLSVSIFINIIGGYWELFTGNRIAYIDPTLAYLSEGLPTGFIGGNINDFSVFLFLSIIVLILQFLFLKTWYMRTINSLGIVGCLHLMIILGSRACVVAVILFIVLISIFIFYNKIIKDVNLNNFILLFFLIIIFSIAMLFISLHSKEGLLAFWTTPGNYSSDSIRYDLTIKLLEIFKNDFGLGIGPGQTIALLGINPHNFYLEILVEYGFLIGMVVIYLSFFMLVYKERGLPTWIDIVLRSTAIPLVLVNIASSSSNRMRMLWIFLAISYLIKKTDIIKIPDEKISKVKGE